MIKLGTKVSFSPEALEILTHLKCSCSDIFTVTKLDGASIEIYPPVKDTEKDFMFTEFHGTYFQVVDSLVEPIVLWSVKTPDKDSNSSYLDITKDGDNFVLVNAMEVNVVQDDMVMTGISMSKEDVKELISKLTLLLE